MLRRLRNNVTVHPDPFDVELNCLPDKLTRFFQRRGRGNATRKIGDVRAVTGSSRFKENCVLAHFNSACLSIDLWVFGSKSTEG